MADSRISGHTVTISGMSMNMPNTCCRCGEPSTTQLSTSTQVRGFGNKTRSVTVPYCAACAQRAKKINGARTMLVLSCVGVGLVTAGFGWLAPFLPVAALILVPAALTAVVGSVLLQRAGDSIEKPHGAWMSHAKGQNSTFFCTNEKWAQAFAQANNATPVAATIKDAIAPRVIGVIVALCAAAFIAFAVRPDVYVDNESKTPLQIWIDGKPSIVAQVAPNGNGTRPKITVPIGKHKFGWSPVGAKAPTEETQPVSVKWMGDHLYNPGKTSCYFLDVTIYGSASDKGMEQGPMPISEFYTFRDIDNWFADNPHTISTKSSGETRTSIGPIKICKEMVEHSCSLKIREDMIECTRKAYAKNDKSAYEACFDAAVARCQGR